MSAQSMDAIHSLRGIMLQMEASPEAHTPKIQSRLNECRERIDLMIHHEFMSRMIEGL
jgi:hypothetical protein